MEKIKNEILDYLESEKIESLSFDSNSSESGHLELVLKCAKSNLANWSYFTYAANQYGGVKNYVEMKFDGENIRFRFRKVKDNHELEILKCDLEVFLDALKKKFYKVSPKMPGIHILIKPSHRCNLDCKYCFDKIHRERIKCDMSMEVLDRIIDVASKTVRHLYLSFHGGEPAVVGLNWYKEAFDKVISKYPMLSFKFDFVSNGTLLNDEWIDFFKKHNITFCVSYQANHQEDLRCSDQNKDNEKADNRLMKNVENIIRSHNIGVVDVVTNRNYKDMIKTYEFYKSVKRTVAFNVVNENIQTGKNNLNMSPQDYANEYLKFFRYWLYDKDGIYERTCANMLTIVTGGSVKDLICEHRDCRGERFTINPIGEIYPCDKFMPERYKICSVFDIDTFDQINTKEGFNLYCSEVQERYETACSGCNYFHSCYGGCNASVIQCAGDGKGIDKFACEAHKLKFNGVYEILREVDSANYDDINPQAVGIMSKTNFYSVKEIRDILPKLGIDIELQYDQEDLFKCSEFNIFAMINYGYSDNKYLNRKNIFSSNTEENSFDGDFVELLKSAMSH